MSNIFSQALNLFAVEKEKPNTAPKVGYRCAQNSGWFRTDRCELAEGFPISAEDVVIDVGCGDGGTVAFAANLGAEIIATDIDPEMVRKTRDRLSKSKAKAYRVEVSDSNPLPVEDSVCTRIIALEVLEHVDDPHQFMRELVRVAKPGALFLLAVPDYRSEAVQQGIAPDSYWEKPNHIRVFGRDELAGLARESGLSVTHSECKSFFWAMWWTLFWARDQQFGAPENPVLFHWTQTWNELLNSRGGERIARKLDETMPKSQVVVARKAA